MAKKGNVNLNTTAPGPEQIYAITMNLKLPLGYGFLKAPESKETDLTPLAEKMNELINNNAYHVGFIIGFNHAKAIVSDRASGKWYSINPSDGEAIPHHGIKAICNGTSIQIVDDNDETV